MDDIGSRGWDNLRLAMQDLQASREDDPFFEEDGTSHVVDCERVAVIQNFETLANELVARDVHNIAYGQASDRLEQLFCYGYLTREALMRYVGILDGAYQSFCGEPVTPQRAYVAIVDIAQLADALEHRLALYDFDGPPEHDIHELNDQRYSTLADRLNLLFTYSRIGHDQFSELMASLDALYDGYKNGETSPIHTYVVLLEVELKFDEQFSTPVSRP